MIDEAIKQWNSGSVVALTWHVCPPTVGETCNWDSSGILSSLSNSQWSELITDGSNLNNLWKARLDTIVPYLKQLANAGVVAIWRPIHEMNEGWSWWGGRPGQDGSIKLYQITHDYFTKYHGLNNLVWTWCVKDVGMDSIGSYWPSDNNYVDVASLDVWMNRQPSADHYNKMLEVAQGKPIALAEVGSVPSPSVIQSQPKWAWFMVWAEYLKDPSFNTDDSVKQTYYLPTTLHQDDINIGG
jgi:mannan endo-1,4-beta-mannosidase